MENFDILLFTGLSAQQKFRSAVDTIFHELGFALGIPESVVLMDEYTTTGTCSWIGTQSLPERLLPNTAVYVYGRQSGESSGSVAVELQEAAVCYMIAFPFKKIAELKIAEIDSMLLRLYRAVRTCHVDTLFAGPELYLRMDVYDLMLTVNSQIEIGSLATHIIAPVDLLPVSVSPFYTVIANENERVLRRSDSHVLLQKTDDG